MRRRLLAAALTVVVGACLPLGWRWWVLSRPLAMSWVDPDPGPRPLPDLPTGPLSGLTVYLSAGHGLLLHRKDHDGDPIAWGTQRDRSHGMIEDEWTARFVREELAPELEAAGATVIALRERDTHPDAVVVEEPAGVVGALGEVPEPSAESGSHLRLLPGGGATWEVPAVEPGHWYVYARWVEAPDQDRHATYTVVTGDVVREVVIDQTVHGGTWFPLGDVCLDSTEPITVYLTGSGEGRLSADAVRVGGGTFHVVLPWNLELRSAPYSEVAMAHQLERLGGPDGLDIYDCGSAVSDMRLRAHWASSVWPPGEEAVYLSIHTNAGGGRGLTVFYGVDTQPPTQTRPESRRLAKLLEDGVVDAVRERDPEYRTMGTRPGDYSEISPVHDALPSALLEMGFHDDRVDAARLQTVAFRQDAARGIVDGLIAWRAGEPAGDDLPLGPRGAVPPPDLWARPE